MTEQMLGASTEKSGSLQNLGPLFVTEHRREPTPVYFSGTQMNRYVPIVPGEAFRDSDSPQRRDAVLAYYRDLLDVLAEFPPFAVRAGALADAHRRIIGDPELLDLHRTRSVTELAEVWRTRVLTDADRTALPDFFGAAEHLSWTLTGLRAVHERLLATAGPEGAPFLDLLAALVLRLGLDSPPATIATSDLGVDGVAEIRRSMSALRAGFDGQAWRQKLRDWLERAIVAGRPKPPASGRGCSGSARPLSTGCRTCPRSPTTASPSRPATCRACGCCASRAAPWSTRSSPGWPQWTPGHRGRAARTVANGRFGEARGHRRVRAGAGGTGRARCDQAEGGAHPRRGQDRSPAPGIGPAPGPHPAAHGVRGQPRYRQDHRGQAHRAHLRRVRRARLRRGVRK